jgi:hypothetical protein
MKLFILATTPFYPYFSERRKIDNAMNNIFIDLIDFKEYLESLTNNKIDGDYLIFYHENFVINKRKEVNIYLKDGHFLCGILLWRKRDDI